ncbi:UvrD-helicase domain-containing protein [Brevibacterium sp. UCMA 11754]|uniref:UvrD-helicase domain-containing protein n=1 Tax=Brevibacterium sp. UCMA 11754 TaxID=2749198 RepID=UPI001F3A85D8|nr:UvrD-helicase domain-containing protein [Brevibacterium sp. UCMA 11754]MCF2571114.1 UvrD-helicase domain-containing protein [Brevibacterium sp. UCMA 11754]
MANNHLTLAAAGSGKTQSIVNASVRADPDEQILILTYTAANQEELRERLARIAGKHHNIEVRGWFSFLINDIVRPYLPFAFSHSRVCGFDFKSAPQQGVSNYSWDRYFNKRDEVRKVHLSQLAHHVNKSASGRPLMRLERVYDRIFIDEVQDLCGWDLEILRLLMGTSLPLDMVGDVRQAILLTNPRETKNKKYQYLNIWDWFRGEEAATRLAIVQMSESYRCRPEIVEMADSLFSPELGFSPTTSRNTTVTGHDGIFLVKSNDVGHYVETFRPLVLRRTANSGKAFERLKPINIGVSKGLGREHVLIIPTNEVKKLLQCGTPLEQQRAAYLYVALTRARQSVAFILDEPANSPYPYWQRPSES